MTAQLCCLPLPSSSTVPPGPGGNRASPDAKVGCPSSLSSLPLLVPSHEALCQQLRSIRGRSRGDKGKKLVSIARAYVEGGEPQISLESLWGSGERSANLKNPDLSLIVPLGGRGSGLLASPDFQVGRGCWSPCTYRTPSGQVHLALWRVLLTTLPSPAPDPRPGPGQLGGP